MRLVNLFIISSLFTTSLFAVELSQATNQQLIRELSKRLNGNGGNTDIAFFNAFCSGDDINLQLETQNNSTSKVIDMRTSMECNTAVTNLKKGQFSGLLITAFCDSDLLYKVKASATGRLDLTTVDHRTSLECNNSARNINRL